MKAIILNASPRKNWNTAQILPCCDTLQVKDYSKFNMAGFNEKHKKEHHAKQFPKDLAAAREMGAELVRLSLQES